MYVNVTHVGVGLAEIDVFTAFEVRTPLNETELAAALAADAPAGVSGLGSWGYVEGGHAWVSRERIIAEIEPFHEHATRWREQFEGMIAYATKQGWLDESGQFVRAHIDYL